MPKLDPNKIVDDQIKSVQAKTTKYQENVRNPRRSFKTAAIEANAKRIQKLQQSISDGTWEAAMNGVDEQGAINTAAESGQALAQGVAKRKNKLTRFWSGWAPVLNQQVDEISRLPQDSDSAREDRMIQNLRKLKANKGKWR